MTDNSTGDTERKLHDYDVDKRFAHIRVEVLGQEYTDVVRVCEQFPELPDGITVYVEDIDAVDLKQSTGPDTDQNTDADGELEEAVHWVERELREARRALWEGKTGKAFSAIEAAQDEFETVEETIRND